MVEKAENEQAKLRMKRMKLENIRTDAQIRAERERMQSAEIRRLRA
jgi:hypothetical protein